MQESAFLSLIQFKSDLLGHLFRGQSEVATILPDIDKSFFKFTLAIQFGWVDLDIACKVGGCGFRQIEETSEDGAWSYQKRVILIVIHACLHIWCVLTTFVSSLILEVFFEERFAKRMLVANFLELAKLPSSRTESAHTILNVLNGLN